MKIKSKQSNVKILRQGDTGFLIKDGLMVSPRAGFEVDTQCPKEYRMIIHQCIEYGWIKPVAYVLDKELMVDILYGGANV